MNGFEKLMRHFELQYYGGLVMTVFELIAIIVGLLFVRKDKIGVLFLVYLAFDFLVFICATYLQVILGLKKAQANYFIHLANNLIALVELLVYFYFFSKILRNKSMIVLLKIFATTFVIIILLFVVTKYTFLTNRLGYLAEIIETIEFLFLVPPCFLYFFELFENDPAIDLYHRPSFWIVTGIFFYAVISVPDYLLNNLVTRKYHNYWGITYLLFFSIPFTVNFIFLTKAFLCKKPLTI